ncbi:MAG: hypothetical protein KatS3mg064_2661 [Tepidiforma sp.]|nr:MAG: hypothetical protein KatS3mg064_2661 [Tepidiforma sp.]
MTSIVRPFIARTTSPGFVAVPEGMFSVHGAMASTFSFAPSFASAHAAASTFAAPVMSAFIASMFAAGLMLIPPVSNVIPLPTSARSQPSPPRPRYPSRMSFGGSALPRATDSSDPIPFRSMSSRSSTSISSPASRASAAARSASIVGVRWFEGSFAQSRAMFVASARMLPRSTARSIGASFTGSNSTMTSSSISARSSPGFDLCFTNR